MMCCSEGFFAKTCPDSVSDGFCTVDTWLSSQGHLSVFGSVFYPAGHITEECVGTVFTSGTRVSDTTQQPHREDKMLLSSAPVPGHKYLSRAALHPFFLIAVTRAD